jgi:putative transposase
MFEGWPFHVTQRGNHKKTVFDDQNDRVQYLSLLRLYADRFAMSVWAYCLMPNHVHLIVVGRAKESIPRAVGNAHREYSRLRNRRHDVTGHLWSSRYYSTMLDDSHLWAAVRYVELNPVRASMVEDAVEFPWSSARAHAGKSHDPLLDPKRPFPGHIGDWSAWLSLGLEEETARRIRLNTQTGEPTGCREFVNEIEARLRRRVRAGRSRNRR